MNEPRIETLVDKLTAAAAELAHEDATVEPELLLDAVELVNGLKMEIVNLEAICSNQRAELQRLRSYEGVY
jgi:hypothetical protein